MVYVLIQNCRMKVFALAFGFLCLVSTNLSGQSGIPKDSLDILTQDTLLKKKWQPIPKKALLWSIIPGGGQIYNRKWWKVPLVYGATYGMYRVVDYNQDLYRRFKTAYLAELNDQPHEFTGTSIDNAAALRNLRDKYDKNTQTYYAVLGFVYLLQGIEAYVDAHLQGFDVDEDLGFRLRPTFNADPLTAQPVLGIGIVLPLGK